MSISRLVVVVFILLMVCACGEDPVETSSAEQSSATTGQQQSVSQATGSSVAQTTTGQGGVSAYILPEQPFTGDCLRVSVQGTPGSKSITWKVNGNVVSSGTESTLCDDSLVRGAQVLVEVGTSDQGATAAIVINNSLPEITDIVVAPENVFAGTDVVVTPVVEDKDGDEVDFTFQWLINGEDDPALTEATLPGSFFTKGDTIQVVIVPNDFIDDGQAYVSSEMLIPNAQPRITSQPPQEITSIEYSYQVVAEDPDDNLLSYRLAEAPEGMTIDEGTGLIQWPLVEARPGEHTITIFASDPSGAEAVQEYTLTLSPASN